MVNRKRVESGRRWKDFNGRQEGWDGEALDWVAGAMPVSLGQRVARKVSLRTFSADHKLWRKV